MRRLLPGFRLSLSFTLVYLGLLVLVPLCACLFTAAQLSWGEFRQAVWTPRAKAAYALTLGTSAIAACISVAVGLLLAWVFVRYTFPLKRFFDSLIDLPFALPTAVAGLVFASLYSYNGWLGQFLVPLGIEAAYSRLAIVLMLVFLGFPFVVRTLQPVLQSIDVEVEEASASLGANRWQTFRRVILPALIPAMMSGFAQSFARGLGEYGSVVFVSGNMPFKTEIASVLIVGKLEAFAYKEATAIALVLLVISFSMLIFINGLEKWTRKQEGT